MSYHGEDTTITTKEVIKTTTTKIRMTIMVKRIGTKTTRVPITKGMAKKESKDKDVLLMLTKNVKFHCPAGFDENIFACACRMIQEKVDSTRQSGIMHIKTVNAVEKDEFMCIFNFPRTCMIQHGLRLLEKRTLDHQGTFLIDYRRVTHWKTI